MTNKTTCIKGAYLDRRLVEEDEEWLMAARGNDHLLELYAERLASQKCEYIERDNDDEYNYDVMDYYDDED